MSITPVGTIDQLKAVSSNITAERGRGVSSFQDMLKNAIDTVNETDAQVKADEIKVATGQSDDLHTLMIEAAKADLSLQTLVQVRNKALDAYNEIMKISL